MNALSKDAKGFVDAVVSQLVDLPVGRQEGTVNRVRSLLSKVTAQAKHEKNAHVESALPLTSEEKTAVEALLAKLLGHSVDVAYKVNPDVIAGLRIRVADWVLDSSFLGQLAKMQEHLSL